MKKISQVNNSFPIQSVEEYQIKGPSKTETSSGNAYTDGDTKFLLDAMSVRERYNQLREEGFPHGKAWTGSKANMLPTDDQLSIMREIQDRNPSFYQESREKNIELFTDAAKKKSKIDSYWNIVYTAEDISKLKISI